MEMDERIVRYHQFKFRVNSKDKVTGAKIHDIYLRREEFTPDLEGLARGLEERLHVNKFKERMLGKEED